MSAPDGHSGSFARLIEPHGRCLLLIRHGQTEWNRQDRLATRTDVPLCPAGREQAAMAARSLAGARISRAWTSPLSRAAETARIALAGCSSPRPAAAEDARLVEPDAGLLEGMTFEALRASEAGRRYQDEQNPQFPAGAEPLDVTVSRARSFLADAASEPGRHVAFSHGAFIRILLMDALGGNPAAYRRLKISNCAASLIVFHPGPPHQVFAVNAAPGPLPRLPG